MLGPAPLKWAGVGDPMLFRGEGQLCSTALGTRKADHEQLPSVFHSQG
jgi:hypothetical protein